MVGRLVGLVGNAAVQDSVRVRFCGTSTVVVTASMGRGVAVWADVMLLQRLGVKVLDVGAPRFGVKNESAILLRCSCC